MCAGVRFDRATLEGQVPLVPIGVFDVRCLFDGLGSCVAAGRRGVLVLVVGGGVPSAPRVPLGRRRRVLEQRKRTEAG